MVIYEAQTKYVKKKIDSIKLTEPIDAYKHCYDFFHKTAQDLTREHCIVCGMNSRNIVLFTQILTVGTENQTLVSPRDVIKQVLLNNCSNFILFHNHPTGNPEPSSADARVTSALRQASEIMGLSFWDHIILGEPENDPCGNGYYSFRAAGRL